MRKWKTLIWTILMVSGLLDEAGWAQMGSQEEVEVVVPRVRTLSIGDVIQDCPNCPELVVLPSGTFLMGSEKGWDAYPAHMVTIPQPLAVGRYEVTFSEWNSCVAEGGCQGYRPKDGGFGRGNRPVINVSWTDAQNYIHWLSMKTGKPYRLLSEAEWEYAARGGTQTSYFWGDSEKREVVCTYANVRPCSKVVPGRRAVVEQKTGSAGTNTHTEKVSREEVGSRQKGTMRRKGTLPVGSLRPNAFGLYDMIGNVWELTADCWNRNYDGAPTDGRAWQQGDCQGHVIRGGSWKDDSKGVINDFTSFIRKLAWDNISWRENFIGFRVVRSLSAAPNPYGPR